MSYEAEFRFLQNTFEKCHLQTVLLNPRKPLREQMHMKFFTFGGEVEATFYDLIPDVKSQTIYKIVDSLDCCYRFLQLPDAEEENILLIGPYLPEELTHEDVMEKGELFRVAPGRIPELERYYGSIPVLAEHSKLFVMLDVLAEQIWGDGANIDLVNLEQEHMGPVSPMVSEPAGENPERAIWNMQVMEKRYAYENELMQAVSQGQIHKAERLMEGFSALAYETRSTDSVRNLKNYSIIMNTLLRKAAEQGGVHPVYLDSVSSDFAKRIEGLKREADVLALMKEMFRAYCRLVCKHSIRQYSPPVQKAITYIDSDLTADLSLSALASIQNVSAGYLSALFKQETGQTLTEHVNQKRIKHAMQLLKTTQLQIQTIAQHCGIVDVHYFSKMFKKYVGKTPKEYREKT